MRKKSGSGTPSNNGTEIGRRTILKRAALVLGAGAAMPSLAETSKVLSAPASHVVGDYSVIARAGRAVVEIESGKIAGAIIRRIYSFKGIPYGATTAGQNRFCPAQKPKPWAGSLAPFDCSTKSSAFFTSSVFPFRMSVIAPSAPPRPPDAIGIAEAPLSISIARTSLTVTPVGQGKSPTGIPIPDS
jgi:hypothetical protein